jgi:hypothetical protein
MIAAIQWMTVADVAESTQRHPQTIRAALRAYAASNGRHGLRGSQEGPNCTWRIQPADVDAWVRGEKPAARRLERAS